MGGANTNVYMPEVVDHPDITAFFAAVRQQMSDAGNTYLAVITPKREIGMIPNHVGAIPPEYRTAVEALLPPQPKQRITVIGWNNLQTRDGAESNQAVTERINRHLPFFGYVIGMSALGHQVVVFEGHDSSLEAGCRDIDTLVIDEAMIRFLHYQWLSLVAETMSPTGHLRIFQRSGGVISLPLAELPRGGRECFMFQMGLMDRVRPTRESDAYAEYVMGRELLTDSERPADALAYLNRAVKLHPDNPEFYFVRGTAHFGVQDWKKAHDDLERYLRTTSIPQSMKVESAKTLLGQVKKRVADKPKRWSLFGS